MIAVTLLLSGLVAVASAADVPITWDIPESLTPYATTFINLGDSVTFSWRGLHGVYALEQGPGVGCPPTFELGSPAELHPAAPLGTYTWAPTAPGQYNLACQVGDHCSEGMIISILVGAGPALAPGAEAPMVPVIAPAADSSDGGGEGAVGS